MSSLKEWVIQLRYPYTAGVIAVVWVGTAFLVMLRADAPVEIIIGINSIATIIIALIGFSRGKR